MIVLDASAALELLLNTAPGGRVAARIASPDVSVHAPHLIDVEIAQALRRYALVGDVSGDAGRAALALWRSLDVERHAHDPLLDRVWELRANLTAYDAVYVALAELLDAPLVTCDRRLARAPLAAARVELV